MAQVENSILPNPVEDTEEEPPVCPIENLPNIENGPSELNDERQSPEEIPMFSSSMLECQLEEIVPSNDWAKNFESNDTKEGPPNILVPQIKQVVKEGQRTVSQLSAKDFVETVVQRILVEAAPEIPVPRVKQALIGDSRVASQFHPKATVHVINQGNLVATPKNLLQVKVLPDFKYLECRSFTGCKADLSSSSNGKSSAEVLMRSLCVQHFIDDPVRWLTDKKIVASCPPCPGCQSTGSRLTKVQSDNNFLDGFAWICTQSFCQVAQPFHRPGFFAASSYLLSDLLALTFHWAFQSDLVDILKDVSMIVEQVWHVWLEFRNLCTESLKKCPVFGAPKYISGNTASPIEIAVFQYGRFLILAILEQHTNFTHLRAVPFSEYWHRSTLVSLVNSMIPPYSIICTDCSLLSGLEKNHQEFRYFDPINPEHLNAGWNNLNVRNYMRQHLCNMLGKFSARTMKIDVLQSFLDELMWRERFGHNPGEAFWNILYTLAGQGVGKPSKFIRIEVLLLNDGNKDSDSCKAVAYDSPENTEVDEPIEKDDTRNQSNSKNKAFENSDTTESHTGAQGKTREGSPEIVVLSPVASVAKDIAVEVDNGDAGNNAAFPGKSAQRTSSEITSEYEPLFIIPDETQTNEIMLPNKSNSGLEPSEESNGIQIVSVTSINSLSSPEIQAVSSPDMSSFTSNEIYSPDYSVIHLTEGQITLTITNLLSIRTAPQFIYFKGAPCSSEVTDTLNVSEFKRKLESQFFFQRPIHWLVDQDLVPMNLTCEYCSYRKMILVSDNTLNQPDKYCWICINLKCGTSLPFVRPKFFSRFGFSMHHVLLLVYHWCVQSNILQVYREVMLNEYKVRYVYWALQKLCSKKLQTANPRLGGNGNIVEVSVVNIGNFCIIGALDRYTMMTRLKAMVAPIVYRCSIIEEELEQWLIPFTCVVTNFKDFKCKTGQISHAVAVKNTDMNCEMISRYMMKLITTLFGKFSTSGVKLEIIQGFLDEIQWRERYGITPEAAFWSIFTLFAEEEDNIDIMKTRHYKRKPAVLSSVVPFWKSNQTSKLPMECFSDAETHVVAPDVSAEVADTKRSSDSTPVISEILRCMQKEIVETSQQPAEESEEAHSLPIVTETHSIEEVVSPSPPSAVATADHTSVLSEGDSDVTEEVACLESAEPEDSNSRDASKTVSSNSSKHGDGIIVEEYIDVVRNDDDQDCIMLDEVSEKVNAEENQLHEKQTMQFWDNRAVTICRSRTRILKPVIKDCMSFLKPLSAAKSYAKQKLTPHYVSLDELYFARMKPMEVPPSEKKTYAFNCSLCKQFFYSNVAVMEHTLVHALQHRKKNAQSFSCGYCYMNFSTDVPLKYHMDQLHGEKKTPFACLICCRLFSSPFLLSKHMKSYHVPSEMPYECPACHFRSSIREEITEHFNQNHSLEPHLVCPYCLKMCSPRAKTDQVLFTQIYCQHLMDHQLDAKQLKCPSCCLTFLSSNDVNNHLFKDHISFANKKGVYPMKPRENPVIITVCESPSTQEKSSHSSSIKPLLPQTTKRKSCELSQAPEAKTKRKVATSVDSVSHSHIPVLVVSSSATNIPLVSSASPIVSFPSPATSRQGMLSDSNMVQNIQTSSTVPQHVPSHTITSVSEEFARRYPFEQSWSGPIISNMYTLPRSSADDSVGGTISTTMSSSHYVQDMFGQTESTPPPIMTAIQPNLLPVRNSQKEPALQLVHIQHNTELKQPDTSLKHKQSSIAKQSITTTNTTATIMPLDKADLLVKFDLPSPMHCIECGDKIDKVHFLKSLTCYCKYSTHCVKSFVNHMIEVHSIMKTKLTMSMKMRRIFQKVVKCTCGYHTRNGDKLASHKKRCHKPMCPNLHEISLKESLPKKVFAASSALKELLSRPSEPPPPSLMIEPNSRAVVKVPSNPPIIDSIASVHGTSQVGNMQLQPDSIRREWLNIPPPPSFYLNPHANPPYLVAGAGGFLPHQYPPPGGQIMIPNFMRPNLLPPPSPYSSYPGYNSRIETPSNQQMVAYSNYSQINHPANTTYPVIPTTYPVIPSTAMQSQVVTSNASLAGAVVPHISQFVNRADMYTSPTFVNNEGMVCMVTQNATDSNNSLNKIYNVVKNVKVEKADQPFYTS